MVAAATAIGSAAVIGGGVSAYEGNQAASAQRNAAASASATEQNAFNTEQQNLSPYMSLGGSAQNQLQSQLPSLTAPINMSQASLAQTPGYQFELQQGLKSTQNAAAARGLGVSGAALKGAANYATGLASSNYQQQFNNALTNKQNTYNDLYGVSSLGENAAAGVGNAAMSTAANQAQNTTNAGNATASSDLNTGTAVNNSLQSAQNYFTLQSILGGSNGLYSNNTSLNSLTPGASTNLLGTSYTQQPANSTVYDNWGGNG